MEPTWELVLGKQVMYHEQACVQPGNMAKLAQACLGGLVAFLCKPVFLSLLFL